LNYHRKSAATAFWLSFLYPGVGQFYNGQTGKGITMSVLATTSIIAAYIGIVNLHSYDSDYYYDYRHEEIDEEMLTLSLAGLGISCGTWLWSIIDAPISANAINRRNAALSWDLGKKNTLSLDPAMSYVNLTNGVNNHKTPVYGVSLKLNF
jgi:hypothetical protein